MKKHVYSIIAILAFALGAGTAITLHADGVSTTATVAAASSTTHINGTWFGTTDYGVPGTPGGELAVQIREQRKAYTQAKKDGNLQGMVDNAFWSSVQAWAYNNAGLAKLNAKEYAVAKVLLLKGQAVLKGAEALGAGNNAAQNAAFQGEEDQRTKADTKLAKNLLFVQRELGELPWPKDEDAE